MEIRRKMKIEEEEQDLAIALAMSLSLLEAGPHEQWFASYPQ